MRFDIVLKKKKKKTVLSSPSLMLCVVSWTRAVANTEDMNSMTAKRMAIDIANFEALKNVILAIYIFLRKEREPGESNGKQTRMRMESSS